MENAVQALLIAAGVLIGIMILTLGVSLYSSLGSYIETTQESIISKQTQAFNTQFLKYINCDSSGNIDFTLTIQDIVTAASTAYESNKKYGLDSYSNNNYYVTINMPGETNLEQSINTRLEEILKKGYVEDSGKLKTVEYKCTINNIKVNPTTGRVYEVTFVKIGP